MLLRQEASHDFSSFSILVARRSLDHLELYHFEALDLARDSNLSMDSPIVTRLFRQLFAHRALSVYTASNRGAATDENTMCTSAADEMLFQRDRR